MIERTKLYSDFQLPAINKQNTKNNNITKVDPRPILGATMGVSTAILMSNVMFKNKPKNTFNEVAQMLIMAGFGNIGGVIGGSINKTNEQKKKKIKEAAFQMMNTTIPMLMVSFALSICKSSQKLNKVPIKIFSSAFAMMTGAYCATKITNMLKKDSEPERKYSLKDSIANFDDIIATISIGFKKILDYVPVNKILPFIYAFCGARSGLAGDNKED